MDSENKCIRVFVDGQVQGVGFRYFAQRTALKLDVLGWVRNTFDGKVEVMAVGNQESLEQFISDLRRGPASSYVAGVKVDWREPSGAFSGFHIRPTV